MHPTEIFIEFDNSSYMSILLCAVLKSPVHFAQIAANSYSDIFIPPKPIVLEMSTFSRKLDKALHSVTRVYGAALIFAIVFFTRIYVVSCAQVRQEDVEEENWLQQQAKIPGSVNLSLPVVTVLRISSYPEADLGFRAARDVFHSLPRWNDRFVVKIRTYFTKRTAGQSTTSTLQLTLKALEQPNQTYVGMLGPDYAAEGLVVAQINPIYNLNSVVMSASESLIDVEAFPLLFRVTPPSSDALKLMAHLVNYLRIRRISTLAFRELSYVRSVRSFADYFVRHGNGTVQDEVVLNDGVNSTPETSQLLLTNDNVDYIVSSVDSNMRYVFCNVYQATAGWVLRPTFLGLDYRDVRDIWRPPSNTTNTSLNCTLDELRAAFNGSIFVTYINTNFITDRESRTRPRHDGVSLEQIEQRVQESRKSSAILKNTVPNPFTYCSYDGGFAMYTALYRVDKRMEEEKFGGGLRLHQLHAKKTSPKLWQQFSSMLHDEMAATSFEGATVFKSTDRVAFGKNQGRTGGMELIQFQSFRSTLDGQFTESFVRVGSFAADGTITPNTSLLKFHTDTGEAPHIWRQKYNNLHSLDGMKTKNTIDTAMISIIVAVGVVGLVLAMAAAAWYYRRRHLLRKRQDLNWLLPASSLQQSDAFMYTEQSLSRPSTSSSISSLSSKRKAPPFVAKRPIIHEIKSNTRVFIRNVTANTPISTSKDAADLNRMYDPAATLHRLSHENVNKFIGICLDFRPNTISTDKRNSETATPVVVFEYQEKSSLREMLRQVNNTDWSIDRGLKLCFIADCVRGMRALHEAGVVHGFLHTGNVMLDAKLTCKVANYGLAKFGRTREELEPCTLTSVREHLVDDALFEKKLVFRSPEQTRAGFYGCDVAKSDLYSIGIVMVEILTREAPQFTTLNSPHVSVTAEKVMEHRILSTGDTVLPLLKSSDANGGLRTLVLECANENPAKRPNTMTLAFKRLMQLPEFVSMVSVVESLAVRLQHYANDLEAVVSERTQALFEEASRTEKLLLQILPASVAAELKAGRRVDAEYFECVSVYFSDIADFDVTIGTSFTPMQTVELLNSLYMTFDNVLAKYNVYKVETIGDAYMVAGGLPERNGHKHADELCRFSLAMLQITQKFSASNAAVNVPIGKSNEKEALIRLRIGLHCGPCMAGVIGISLPRYCLFGDTINMASRMQSTSQPNHIHCSSAMRTFTELHYPGKFEWQTRGEISVKGLGSVITHWLVC